MGVKISDINKSSKDDDDDISNIEFKK